MKITSATLYLASGLLAAFATAAHAEDCGKVSIAKMNWKSASLLAEIDRFILTNGYGCEVTLVDGDTIPTFESMNRNGTPDVAPEMWIGSIREELDAAIDEGRLHFAAKALADGGVEGWWIPAYLANAHPEIKTIEDALSHPELFANPDDETGSAAPETADSAVADNESATMPGDAKPAMPAKGVVHNCPETWSCRITTANLFRAYGAEAKGFVLEQAESGDALRNSVIKAFDEHRGWLGYYWAPTALLGKHDMVRLSFGVPYDRTQWNTCTVVENCPDPKPNAWPNSLVFTVVTDSFKTNEGQGYAYLERRSWHNRTVNAMLAWMDENNATAEEAAIHFLKEDDAVWMEWVSLDAASRIESALKEGAKDEAPAE